MYYIEPLPLKRTQTAEAETSRDVAAEDVTLRNADIDELTHGLFDQRHTQTLAPSTEQDDARWPDQTTDQPPDDAPSYVADQDDQVDAEDYDDQEDQEDEYVLDIVTPELAPDVQLIGAMQDIGFKQTQWLVQRGTDYIQLTELLYRTLEQVDGRRTFDEIADAVTRIIDRGVNGDGIRYLFETKFIPLGLIKLPGEDGEDARPNIAMRSALQVTMRVTLMGGRLIEPFARVLRVFFWPPVLIATLLVIVGSQAWVFFVHGLGPAFAETGRRPELLVVIFVVGIASSVLHELGHASGLRYGGGRARRIGGGIYIVYPVFFTDVTESYRLGRWARVRTDVGGFYFSLISAVAVTAFAICTHQEYLLLFVPILDLEIVDEFSPFVRWDGYWVLADLTGIPDLYALMGPFLRSILPGHRNEKIPELKGWVKVVYTLYVLVAIPFLAVIFFTLLISLPTLISYTKDAIGLQTGLWNVAVSQGNIIDMAIVLGRVFLLCVPTFGVLLVIYSLGGMGLRPFWRWGKASLKRRALTLVAFAVLIAGVAILWAPQTNWPQLITSARGLMGAQAVQTQRVQAAPATAAQPAHGGTAAVSTQTTPLTASTNPAAAQPSETLPSITVTCASAVNDSTGQLCVHTQPGAALTIAVNYCGGYGAADASASLRGTVLADRNGNYTWNWVPHTTCLGHATAALTANWNHRVFYYTDTFIVR